MKKDRQKRKVSIPPKEHGFRGINRICGECGKYFSERNGHTCDENDWNY